MDKVWINVNEAITYTERSNQTIRRWIKSNKLNSNCIKKEKGKILINSIELKNDYKFIHEQVLDNIKIEQETADIILKKQDKDLIAELINQKREKTPIFRHSTFWVSILMICLLIITFFAWKYNKNEMIETRKKEISFYKEKINNMLDIYNIKLVNTKTNYNNELKNLSNKNEIEYLKLKNKNEIIKLNYENEIKQLKLELLKKEKTTKI